MTDSIPNEVTTNIVDFLSLTKSWKLVLLKLSPSTNIESLPRLFRFSQSLCWVSNRHRPSTMRETPTSVLSLRSVRLSPRWDVFNLETFSMTITVSVLSFTSLTLFLELYRDWGWEGGKWSHRVPNLVGSSVFRSLGPFTPREAVSRFVFLPLT